MHKSFLDHQVLTRMLLLHVIILSTLITALPSTIDNNRVASSHQRDATNSKLKEKIHRKTVTQFEAMSIDDVREKSLSMAGRIIDINKRNMIIDEIKNMSDEELEIRKKRMVTMRDGFLKEKPGKSYPTVDDLNIAHDRAIKEVIMQSDLRKDEL